MLIENVAGHYWHLKGIAPYSCAVIAEPGWEIVRVTRSAWDPWRDGFEFIKEYLQNSGLQPCALCAVELRSPKALSMEEFIAFNQEYCALLEQWKLIIGNLNPIARTNVVPPGLELTVPALHAFSFVRPNPKLNKRTFVVAGAGELREGTLDPRVIVRSGDTSASAMIEKADYVLKVMSDRLRGLGMDWKEVTTVNVYTTQPLPRPLRDRIIEQIGPAARHGFCWHVTRPPVVKLEFEMDVRGIACELYI